MNRQTKFYIAFLCLLAMARPVYAQYSFEHDSAYSLPYQKIIQQLDSMGLSNKEADFTLRLWVHAVLNPSPEKLVILTVKNGVSKAKLFEFRRGKTDFYPNEIGVIDTGYVALWQSLISNQLFDLKGQTRLKDSAGEELWSGVLDGTICHLELLTPQKSKLVFYHCVKQCTKRYPEIPDFKNGLIIIDALLRFCGSVYNRC